MEKTKIKINYSREAAEFAFKTNNVDALLVTEDGHFFLLKSKSFCIDHCSRKNIKWAELTRSEFEALEGSNKTSDRAPSSDPLDAMSYAELKQFAKDKQIKVSGKQKEILEQIQEHLKKQTPPPAGSGNEDPASGDGNQEPDPADSNQDPASGDGNQGPAETETNV